MAECFVKYSERVGTVKIRHSVMERAPYDLLKFKIAEVKVCSQSRKSEFRVFSIVHLTLSGPAFSVALQARGAQRPRRQKSRLTSTN